MPALAARPRGPRPAMPATAPPPRKSPTASTGSLAALVPAPATLGADCRNAQGPPEGAGRRHRRPSERRPELVRLREAAWRQAAGLGALADPVPKLAHGQRIDAPGGIEPRQAVGLLEYAHVGEAAVLVALQPDTLAARHL